MSEENKEAAAGVKDTSSKKSQDKAAKPGTLAYIGPNRPYDLPLAHNQFFRSATPPAFCREHIKKHPQLAACFVPVGELGAALAALRDNNSELSRAARKVAEETMELRRAAAGGN